jgi:hypothetical protein
MPTTETKKAPGHAGKKGQAIVDWFATHGPATRTEAAEACGCTIARVGEVIRSHGGFEKVDGKYELRTSAPNAAADKKAAAQAQANAAAAAIREAFSPIELPPAAAGTRTGRCEHEKAKKAKTGSCKVCPPVAA